MGKAIRVLRVFGCLLSFAVVTSSQPVSAEPEMLYSRNLSQGNPKSSVTTTGVPAGDLQKITWSKLSNLGPGNQAAGPSNVTPPVLTGSSGNYWVGRLCNGVGQVAIPGGVRTSDYKDLRLKITWAAAGDVNGTQNTFTSGAQYIRIEGVAGGVPTGPFGGRRANIVDTFVGNATGLLRSNKSGQTIGTTFAETELNLDALYNVEPGVITEFGRMIITARTRCDQVMGIDRIEIWGTPKDECPDDPNKTEPGICGCGVADTDSDNDGTPDCNDNCPNDSGKTEPGVCGCGTPDTDSDNDGTPDCNDNCPNDSGKTEPGVCGCGTPDTDSDNDGTPDCNDNCPNDAGKTEPGVCGCGTPDTDSDNDGTPDCNDNCPNDPAKTEPGACGCGIPDTDSDNDGTADCNDNCPTDPGKTDPGACGCGTPDTDSDNDGMPDCNDNCPNDASKVDPGLCGCGIPDSTPMCLYNSDFQLGDMTNWTSSSYGQTSVVTEPTGSGNFAGQMMTGPGNGGDAVRLTIPVNTPDEGFYIQFDAKFLVTEGNLDIAISGVPVMTLAAPLQADSALRTYTVFVGDESLRNLNLEDYSFTYHANSGATLLLDNVAIVPQSAMNECDYEGDPIGTQASWEGISTKNVAGTHGNSKPYWEWWSSSAHTGLLYHSDGISTLSELRAIAAVGWPNQPTRAVYYPCSLWTVDIWPLQDYLNKTPPLLTVNLGVEPDNWSGFVTLPNGSVVPNTPIFTNSGSPYNWNSYSYTWNLGQSFFVEWSHSQATILDPWGHGSETFTPFSAPLPAGDYIIGFQPRGDLTNCGQGAVLRDSARGIGPIPYYSSLTILPQPIYPGLNSNPDYRYALSLRVMGPQCS